MKTYYKTETLEDFLGLIDELREDERFVGKYLTDFYYEDIWKLYKNDTCLVKEVEDDFDSISVSVTHIDNARKEGMRMINHKVDKTDKAKELQKYSEQIAKKKEELSNEHTQDNHKLFNEIITDLEQTYIAKNKDYGNSFEESLNEFGEIAGLVRIGDKFNRAKNLSENKANVIDESKIDTYLDMANYCIMQAMWLMKSKL